MSQYMDHLRIGQELDFKGPKGRFDYSRNMKRCIGAHPPPVHSLLRHMRLRRGMQHVTPFAWRDDIRQLFQPWPDC